MKHKFYIISMVAMLSSMATFGEELSEGFYRVQNYGSGRYLYVRDCTGEVSSGTDFNAIELWAGLDGAISDPGSVMYLKKIGEKWDILSQNTGVHDLVGYYMNLTLLDGYCMVQSEGQYLYEVGNDSYYTNMGRVGAKTSVEMPGKTNYRLWKMPKVESSTNNYFGFKPNVNANNKYYTSFYADFAYTPTNGNIKTWYVTKVDKENAIAVIKEISGTVAKSQPVIIECAGATASDNKIDLTSASGNSASNNLLSGAYFSNGDRFSKPHPGNPALIKFNATTMRVLDKDVNGNLAYVNSSSNIINQEIYENFKYVYADCIPHNTSYLVVDSDCPATLKVMTEEDYNKQYSAVQNVNANTTRLTDGKVYDMQGRFVANNINSVSAKGVYVVDGKKVIK